MERNKIELILYNNKYVYKTNNAVVQKKQQQSFIVFQFMKVNQNAS
jgi:hypothetical protein